MEIIKNSKNNGVLSIREIEYGVAKNMIITNHYSKKWNRAFGTINFGIFKADVLLGCAAFGNLMNTKSYKNITDLGPNSVIELNRLWLSDDLQRNAETIMLSSCFKILRKKYPHIKCVQSFADGRLGCGTTYKAANFGYYGYTFSSFFFEDRETRDVFHKVPLEVTNKPYGFLIKNRRYLDKKLQAFLVKTYRYIYQLDKKCSIKLEQQPYPVYEKGFYPIEHTHGLGLLLRLYLMYSLIGDTEYANKAMQEAKIVANGASIYRELEHQRQNKSFEWFRDTYLCNPKNKSKLLP